MEQVFDSMSHELSALFHFNSPAAAGGKCMIYSVCYILHGVKEGSVKVKNYKFVHNFQLVLYIGTLGV